MTDREIAIGSSAALVSLTVGYALGKIGTRRFLNHLETEQTKVTMWHGIFRKTLDMLEEGDHHEAYDYFADQAAFMQIAENA